ncbi:MAG: TolC family protein [Gemmataceae bacterium]|nr:TolC family protein [Gemmataceae bacterium]
MNAKHFLSWVAAWLASTALLAAQPAPVAAPRAAPTAGQGYALDDLVRAALAQHPALTQAQLEIEAAEGRALQAGKYPNPTVAIGADEIGPKAGIHTLPLISQEIVTAKKLQWARAVAERELDQTFLALAGKRFALVTAVRKAFVEVVAAQRRRDVLRERTKEVAKTLDEANKRIKVLPEEGAEIIPLTFQYELDRISLELAAAQREYAAAWNRLAAAAGTPSLAMPDFVANPFADRLPLYAVDADPLKSQQRLAELRDHVVATHPEVRIAQVGIARAEAFLQRERAQAVPNITLAGGYQRNFNDREHQALYQIQVPLPVFNRNQGGIRAAQADYGRAIAEVSRVQLELSQRLAASYGDYATARLRAERLDSRRATARKLHDQAHTLYFKGGKLSNLQVIQLQRQMIDDELDHLRAWGDAWKAAGAIAGLVLDEDWPGVQRRKE